MKSFFGLFTFLVAILVAILVIVLVQGCLKEETQFKTADHQTVHEIVAVDHQKEVPETTYWYVFYKGGKFIYKRSPERLEDFSSTFFISSSRIPDQIKDAEWVVKTTASDSSDRWGKLEDLDIVELQELDTGVYYPDSLLERTDSLPKADSVDRDSSVDYEIDESSKSDSL